MRHTTCRSCGAKVLWVSTAKGKSMPVDAAPTDRGNLMLTTIPPGGPLTAEAWAPSLFDDGEALRYTSHFATCPQASSWRKP